MAFREIWSGDLNYCDQGRLVIVCVCRRAGKPQEKSRWLFAAGFTQWFGDYIGNLEFYRSILPDWNLIFVFSGIFSNFLCGSFQGLQS